MLKIIFGSHRYPVNITRSNKKRAGDRAVGSLHIYTVLLVRQSLMGVQPLLYLLSIMSATPFYNLPITSY